MGNYFNYAPKIFQNDVSTSLLNAWGHPIDRFGDPRFTRGSGPGRPLG